VAAAAAAAVADTVWNAFGRGRRLVPAGRPIAWCRSFYAHIRQCRATGGKWRRGRASPSRGGGVGTHGGVVVSPARPASTGAPRPAPLVMGSPGGGTHVPATGTRRTGHCTKIAVTVLSPSPSSQHTRFSSAIPSRQRRSRPAKVAVSGKYGFFRLVFWSHRGVLSSLPLLLPPIARNSLPIPDNAPCS